MLTATRCKIVGYFYIWLSTFGIKQERNLDYSKKIIIVKMVKTFINRGVAAERSSQGNIDKLHNLPAHICQLLQQTKNCRSSNV